MFSRDSGDDEEMCSCTFGHSCAWHAEQSRIRDEIEREDSIRRGINPDTVVTGLEEIVFAVELSDALSKQQKEAIMRILFPLDGRTIKL